MLLRCLSAGETSCEMVPPKWLFQWIKPRWTIGLWGFPIEESADSIGLISLVQVRYNGHSKRGLAQKWPRDCWRACGIVVVTSMESMVHDEIMWSQASHENRISHTMISMAKTRMLLHDHYDSMMLPGTRIWGSCEANWDEDPGCAWDVFILGVVWATGWSSSWNAKIGNHKADCETTMLPCNWNSILAESGKLHCKDHLRLFSKCLRQDHLQRRKEETAAVFAGVSTSFLSLMDGNGQSKSTCCSALYCICVPSCPLWTGRSILRVYQWIFSGSSPISPSVGWSDVQPRIAWP